MLLRDQFSLDPRKLFFPPTLRPGCVSSIIQRRLWLLKTWGLPSLLLLHWFLLSCRSVLSLLKPKDAPSHRDPLFAGLKCQASSKSVRGEVLGEGMWQSTGPPSFPFFPLISSKLLGGPGLPYKPCMHCVGFLCWFQRSFCK